VTILYEPPAPHRCASGDTHHAPGTIRRCDECGQHFVLRESLVNYWKYISDRKARRLMGGRKET